MRKHAPIFTVKPIEVLWDTQRQEVLDEIAVQLGVPTVDTTTPDWFSKRLPACKEVMKRMTMQERNSLYAEVDRIRKEGVPEEKQRR